MLKIVKQKTKECFKMKNTDIDIKNQINEINVILNPADEPEDKVSK